MPFEHYPKPAIAVDIIVLYWDGKKVSVPLVRRGSEPFQGRWALPGGFLEMDETLEAAARRELREETNLDINSVLRGPIFDAVNRDPRGRVISVPHIALVEDQGTQLTHGSDAAAVEIHTLSSLPQPLAFDHDEIVDVMCRFAAEEVLASRLGAGLTSVERGELARALTESGKQHD